MAQTSPFAAELGDALAREAEVDEAEPVAANPEPAQEPSRAPEPSRARESLPEPAPLRPRLRIAPETVVAPAPAADAVSVRRALLAAGVPARLADEVLREVDLALRPFDPVAPYLELARRALAHRIRVTRGWRTRRRTIALVGLPGSGRTLTAAKLCAAYAAAGHSVSALSLEQPRDAMRLGELTADLGVGFEVAAAPDLVPRAKRALRRSEVVVVDTPPLAQSVDGRTLARTLRLLGALKADETHLLLPARAELTTVQGFFETMRRRFVPSHVLLTHADVQTPNGVGVGLALAQRRPIAYVGHGDRPGGGLRAAEPEALAGMVLQ